MPAGVRTSHDDEAVRLQRRGGAEIVDLAGAVAGSAQFDRSLRGRDQARRVGGFGRGGGHGDASAVGRTDGHGLPGSRVEDVAGAAEDAVPAGQPVLLAVDGHREGPVERDHNAFLVRCGKFDGGRGAQRGDLQPGVGPAVHRQGGIGGAQGDVPGALGGGAERIDPVGHEFCLFVGAPEGGADACRVGGEGGVPSVGRASFRSCRNQRGRHGGRSPPGARCHPRRCAPW